MTRGLTKGETSQQIIKTLKDKGVSYRRENMLYDLRRKEASYHAKTPEKRANAKRWFDNVYEKFRKEKGLNSKQASKLWEKTVTQSFDTIEEAREGVEMWELYEALR